MQGRSKNSKEQRRENAYLVLNVIRKNNGISRNDIAKQTGLSIPSVTKIVDFLYELNLLSYSMEYGGNQRKIPFYTFYGEGYAVLGLEFARTKNVGLICDLKGNVFERFVLESITPDYQVVLKKTAKELLQLIKEGESRNVRILGLGIGSPGPIDTNEKKIINPPDFYNWKDVSLGKDFEDILGIPVFLEKGTDASALAEKFMGPGKSKPDFIYVEIGEGIGSAIVYKNKIFRGNSKIYSSLGHTTISIDGPICECGNRGCLEMYAKKSIIQKKLQNIKSVKERENIFRETAKYLATGISNLILITGIETVILGGELIYIYDELFQCLESEIPRRAFPSLKRNIEILKSNLLEDVVALGGALWVAESALLNIDSLDTSIRELKGNMHHEIVIS